LCGDRAARRAADTPTGPAPITARSYGLSDMSSGGMAALSCEVVGDERWCRVMMDCGWGWNAWVVEKRMAMLARVDIDFILMLLRFMIVCELRTCMNIIYGY